MRALMIVVFAACMAIPAVGFADWAEAFPPGAVATYLPAPGTRVMVIGVDSADAADALSLALSHEATVIGAGAVGKVDGLSDEEILRKAAAQPVDVFFVVRPAGMGDPVAAVTMYRKNGAPIGGFVASVQTPAPASGVVGATSSEVAATQALGAGPVSKEDMFLDQFVGFEKERSTKVSAMFRKWNEPYRGAYRQPLTGRTFYEHVGQPDLADKYRRRSTAKWLLIGAGAGCVLGGSLLMFASPRGGANAAPMALGGITMIGGAGAIAGGVLMNPHPVSDAEARVMAAGFNRELANELGVDAARLQQEKKGNVDIVLGPAPGGAMVGARAAF